jgi:hypothetical protein
MSKQTAVNWLIEQLSNYDSKMIELFNNEIEQAKEMDKQQTIQFFKDYDSYILKGGYMSLQQYYKKKFKD